VTSTNGVAVVTGATGVIGAASCRALALAGYRVAGMDARGAPDGADWHHVVARLDRPEEVLEAFGHVGKALGDPTVLVNNAGIYLARDFLDTNPEEFDDVMASNVKSAFLCSQAFARRLSAGGLCGSIVNVASVSGRTGSEDAAYGASKGALLALTKSLSRSLAGRGIRVNAVAPGIVESDMSRRIPADRRLRYLAEIPLARFAQPDEIAGVIAALVSDTTSYMSGAVVDVNGGLY
jgi:3-oxoacyl-[acyl-carrier protein] reductase